MKIWHKPRKEATWVGRDGVRRKRNVVSGNVLMRCQCELCKKCWRVEGATRCIYGGPYKREGDTNADEE